MADNLSECGIQRYQSQGTYKQQSCCVASFQPNAHMVHGLDVRVEPTQKQNPKSSNLLILQGHKTLNSTPSKALKPLKQTASNVIEKGRRMSLLVLVPLQHKNSPRICNEM
eukprot:1355623-Amphidinium_carterae.1